MQPVAGDNSLRGCTHTQVLISDAGDTYPTPAPTSSEMSSSQQDAPIRISSKSRSSPMPTETSAEQNLNGATLQPPQDDQAQISLWNIDVTSYEMVAILVAVVAVVFAWWRCWSADGMLRLEMFKEATKLAAVDGRDRSYMERVAGIFILTSLVDQKFWLSRLLRRHGEYDEVVGFLVEIFVRYRRLVFPDNAPDNHQGGQLDYRSREYLLIREWINNRAPHRIVGNIRLPENHPFVLRNGKLEANNNSLDYRDWTEATGQPPY